MLNKSHSKIYFNEDANFNYLYPKRIRDLSEMHWTPLEIAKNAGIYLSVPNTKVLEIGSGVGKFCITAGFYEPKTLFYGIEQRKIYLL